MILGIEVFIFPKLQGLKDMQRTQHNAKHSRCLIIIFIIIKFLSDLQGWESGPPAKDKYIN